MYMLEEIFEAVAKSFIKIVFSLLEIKKFYQYKGKTRKGEMIKKRESEKSHL